MKIKPKNSQEKQFWARLASAIAIAAAIIGGTVGLFDLWDRFNPKATLSADHRAVTTEEKDEVINTGATPIVPPEVDNDVLLAETVGLVNFGGVYESDTYGCSRENPITGDCSCPTDYTKVVLEKLRGKTDDSTLVFCEGDPQNTAEHHVLVGAYEKVKDAEGMKNPFTEALSCLPGSSERTYLDEGVDPVTELEAIAICSIDKRLFDKQLFMRFGGVWDGLGGGTRSHLPFECINRNSITEKCECPEGYKPFNFNRAGFKMCVQRSDGL